MKPWTMAAIFMVLIYAKQQAAYAQTSAKTCGFILAEKAEQKRNPFFLSQRKKAQMKLRQMLSTLSDTTTIYTLPVVVHVIHTGTPMGSPDNPTDSDIADMIATLNNSFRKNGTQSGGADINLQFQLAVRSPQCGNTTGINRVNGSAVPNYISGGIAVSTFSGSADEWKVKELSRWPHTDYINIWIVNKINGTAAGTGGFAYFPEYASAAQDGIVINAAFVNGISQTITHEMGHYLELHHTFYDDAFETQCPRTDSCSFYGDRVCDTEPGKIEYDCSVAVNQCTGLPYQNTDPALNYTTLHNYMNYTDCPWMFTQGQKLRMRAALFAFRHGLISSGALSPPPSTSAATACIPVVSTGRSYYYGVQKVEFNTLSVYSNTSMNDSGNYVDRSCSQRTTVVKGQTYPLIITGSYFNPCWFKAYIDYNNDGDFSDAGETLLNSTSYNFNGTDTIQVLIPTNGVSVGVALRLRVIAEQPSFEPSACMLTGTLAEGAGQAEDYGIVIVNRQIISLTSGNWNVPSTWECNCLPQPGDEVIIKIGHTVNITPAMGEVECSKLTLETGSTLNVSGKLKTNLN